jgi:chemotaxis protein MotB
MPDSKISHGSKNSQSMDGSPIWLMTFGDVTALMLTFFIMLFATTETPSEKWEAVNGSMESMFRFDESGYSALPKTNQAAATVDLEPSLSIAYLEKILRDNLKRDPVLKDSTIRLMDDRLVISLPTSILFPEGSAALEQDAREAIFQFGGVFRNIGNQIEMRGHAEPARPDGASDADTLKAAWELSLARALGVAKVFRDSGYSGEFHVLGVGDSRYKHLSAQIPESQRQALARRVDIVVYPTTRSL